MRAKLADVRSESWLDLSVSKPVEQPKWMSNLQQQHQQQAPTSGQTSQLLGSSSTLFDPNSTSSKGQDHLLIRWRQQTYQLKRRSSSASLIVSSLAHSVPISEFVPSPSSVSQARASCDKLDVSLGQSQFHFLSRRLERFKSKLESRANRQPARQTHAQPLNSSGLKSPLARSLSSLSDKLANLRISWTKRLLNPKSQQRVASLDDFYSRQSHSVEREQVDRRLLTQNWIANHHLLER